MVESMVKGEREWRRGSGEGGVEKVDDGDIRRWKVDGWVRCAVHLRLAVTALLPTLGASAPPRSRGCA